MILLCEKCGSPDVETKMWVRWKDQKIMDSCNVGDNWCPDCKQKIKGTFAEAIQILIIPSSDHEKSYEEFETFEEARTRLKDHTDEGLIFQFLNQEDADIFIKGYQAGTGYLGSGLYFIKNLEK